MLKFSACYEFVPGLYMLFSLIPLDYLFFTCGAAGCVYIHATSSHFRQFVSGMETQFTLLTSGSRFLVLIPSASQSIQIKPDNLLIITWNAAGPPRWFCVGSVSNDAGPTQSQCGGTVESPCWNSIMSWRANDGYHDSICRHCPPPLPLATHNITPDPLSLAG